MTESYVFGRPLPEPTGACSIVAPAELQQASTSQSGLTALGQLLGMAGMLTGLGSMASAPTGAAAGSLGGVPQAGMGSLGLNSTWFPMATDQATIPFSFANEGQAALNPMNFGAGFSPFGGGIDTLNNLGYGAPLSLPYF